MMRILFMGSPEHSAWLMGYLLSRGFEICAVVTQPDRPKSRGLKLRPTPVKEAALRAGLPLFAPTRLSLQALQHIRERHRPDIGVIFSFGQILPPEVVESMLFLNLHLSLLPRWRGPAPVEHTILAGDRETGVTIQRVVAEVDAGDVLAAERIELSGRETAGELRQRLTEIGASLLERVLLERRFHGRLQVGKPTYAPKISRKHAALVWSEPADVVDRKVRAFNPKPGAFCTAVIGDRRIEVKILYGEPVGGEIFGQPGSIRCDSGRLLVCCGDGLYSVESLQPENRKVMDARAFINGYIRQQEARFE